MAFPKKKSRIISIEGIKYRWLVSPNDGYNVFVAQGEEMNGRTIEVAFATQINSFWVEFPNVKDLNLKVLMPKDAEMIIRQALHLGWNPEEKGKPIVYDLIDDKLSRREK